MSGVFVWFVFLLAVCKAENAVELTDSEFDETLGKSPTALVMFYAPWCGHCKKLKPEFEKAASILKTNDPPILLAKVDCTDGGKDSCGKFSVTGYPTLKIFKDGELSSDYNGPREANGIVKFMRSRVGPASKQLLSVSDLDKFRSAAEVSVVAFVNDASDVHKAFEKVSDKMRENVRFAHTFESELLEKHGSDVVVLFRPKHMSNKFEDSSLKSTSTDTASLQKFINDNYHGLVGHRTADNTADFHEPLVIAYYDVDYVKNPKGTNYWRNRVMKVAEQYSGRVTFAVAQHNDFQHELEEFGRGYVSGEKPVVVARDAERRKFVMEQEFSVDNLNAFVSDMMAGSLTPYLKSEPIPESSEGAVTVAVAKNFDQVVTDDKDTLIEFYAPWCGHCKKLTPIYEELATKLKDESELAIVKMDATANDVPAQFNVRGFPTIFYVPKGKKDSPVSYEGGREVNDFIKYLAKHSTNGLSGYDRTGKPKKTEL